MHDLLNKRRVVSILPTPTGTAGGPVDFNATGDKYIVTPAQPIDIYRYGIVTIEALDPDAGGFVLALDHRPAAGSDTGRTEVATLTLADANVIAAGSGAFREVALADADGETAEDGTLRNVGPAGPMRVEPGEEAVLEVTNAVGATSTGYVWVEYVEHAFDEEALTEVTS